MAAINVVRKRGVSIWAGHNKLAFDYWFLLAAAALLVIGFLMVYSTTFDLGDRFKDNPVYYVTRQMTAMALGIGVIVVIMQFDYHALTYISVPLIAFTCIVLFLMNLFGQMDAYGAVRTLSDGSYQPSELAKLASIIYVSHWLSSKGDRIREMKFGLIPFGIICGVIFGLIVAQPALSAASLILIINFTLFFVAGADLKQLLVAGAFAAAGVVIMMLVLPHASQRVDDYLIAVRDPLQAGYQVRQTLAALANGGFWGVGLGQGNQKFGPLPLAHTDGVFAILGEETGLVGSVGVILLFGFLIWRGFRVANHARDPFGFLLAVGITAWIGYQALINIAVITAIIPFTGMPMPFLSYGGSSMLMTLVGIGILLNISRDGVGGRQPNRRQPVSNRQD
ncbi:MAG: putative lipid II flippase FtsW [Anaerolineae bacterium]|nr:putative lipid II flippase FtsW [Anaerolineae bacterium]RIK24104.1 MAG: stage V sporulation protein E [Anaerolineae bacterium]